MKQILSLAILGLFGGVWTAPASEADSVLVVYNSRMSESKDVAQYYARRRGVPESQVIGFRMSRTETVSRSDYERQLERPLLEHLEHEGLFRFEKLSPDHKLANGREGLQRVSDAKIRYLVLCLGVPLRIDPDASIKEEAAEKMSLPLRRNESAVDSELSALPMKRLRKPLTGPLVNPLYRATNSFQIHPTNQVLMVARLDGPSPEIAKGLVDKAIQAETNGFWGRAYFDARGLTEGALKRGDDMILRSANGSRAAGFETFIDNQPPVFAKSFWMSHTAIYMGWYDENVSGPFKSGEVDFMPGAIAYHLHSFNAVTVRNPNRQWVGPLLNLGATVTFGTVHEPYLGGTIDLPEFLKRIITLRFNYGEAAYSSIGTLSWMTTFVGDPLYRPYAKPNNALHAELLDQGNSLVEWSFLQYINALLVRGAETDKAIEFLTREPTTANSAVLQEKLGDLYFEQKQIDPFANAYESALSLNPPRRQQFRLLENLGIRLADAGENAKAKAVYERLVELFPEHPNAAAYRKRINEF